MKRKGPAIIDNGPVSNNLKCLIGKCLVFQRAVCERTFIFVTTPYGGQMDVTMNVAMTRVSLDARPGRHRAA